MCQSAKDRIGICFETFHCNFDMDVCSRKSQGTVTASPPQTGIVKTKCIPEERASACQPFRMETPI
jgi:hypothetical protein